MKKKLGLIGSGIMLSLGSSIVEKMPSNSAKEGIQKGFSTAGSFYPSIVAISAGGLAINMLKKIKKGGK